MISIYIIHPIDSYPLFHPQTREFHDSLPLTPSRPPNQMPGQQLYEQSLSLSYNIRVSVHNGRTFVGPSYDLTNITHLDVPGWKVLQVNAYKHFTLPFSVLLRGLHLIPAIIVIPP